MTMSSMVQIEMKTRVWAAGMAEAQPIWALRELRWLTARRSGQLSSPLAEALDLQILASHRVALILHLCVLSSRMRSNNT